jgi:hypothetical protein
MLGRTTNVIYVYIVKTSKHVDNFVYTKPSTLPTFVYSVHNFFINTFWTSETSIFIKSMFSIMLFASLLQESFLLSICLLLAHHYFGAKVVWR